MNFLESFRDRLQEKLSDLTNKKDTLDVDHENLIIAPIHTNFRLPITYLESSKIHSLNDVVASDLELSRVTSNDKTMYNYLFNPTHKFADEMIDEWKKYYTTDVEFLGDSQKMLTQMSYYKIAMDKNAYKVDYDAMMSIWKDTKLDDSFLEKYHYMDWEILKHLNNSSSFLQAMSFINIASPVISLIIPILFFIFPFLILKIQGIPITFSVYLDVLKSIAKNHFIGKALYSMGSLSWDKLIYLLVTFALYLFQIYQNISICKRFYRNIKKINNQLTELKRYTGYSIESMEHFLHMIGDKPSYNGFKVELTVRLEHIKNLNAELSKIYEFNNSVSKFNEFGYLLKCYYEIHSNPDHEQAIRYSVGFEGFINNLCGVHDNLLNKKIAFASFDVSLNCQFTQQYYPVLMNEDHVKNDCNFDKNMIISSPNKSGKTTILKTTTINIIFTQQFGCGFYKSAVLNPYTHIHSYINIPDTSGRDSLFQAESRRCKEILDIISANNDPIKDRHFCLFDELFSGTNPEEASKAGYAFLKYLEKYENVNYILTTHYFSICKKFDKSERTQNYKMMVNVDEDGSFKYTYKIKKGISKIKGGIRVLKDMNYPTEIIRSIEYN